jgi:hypothetical protein
MVSSNYGPPNFPGDTTGTVTEIHENNDLGNGNGNGKKESI